MVDNNTYTKKISELSVRSSIDGSEVFPIVHGGETKQVTASILQTLFNASPLETLVSCTDVSVSNVNNNQYLAYDSTMGQWTNRTIITTDIFDIGTYLTSASASTQYSLITHNHALVSLSDVSSGTLTNNDVLIWSSASSEFVPGQITLATLPDFSVSGAVTNHVLAYNSADAEWINVQLSITQMSNVSVSAILTDGEVLTWVSSQGAWQNVPPASGGIFNIVSAGDVSVSSPADGSPLIYNSAGAEWNNGTLDVSFITGLGAYLTSASASAGYATLTHNHALASITGISVSGATDTHVLAYSSAASEWQNRQLSSTDISDIGTYLTSASASASYATVAHNHVLTSISNVSINAETDTHVLAYSSADSQWKNRQLALADISDNGNLAFHDTLASASDYGLILTSASASAAYASIAHTHALTGLTSVSISAPVDTHVIAYVSAAGEWQNRQLSSTDISDIGTYLTSASASTAYQPVGDYLTSASIISLGYITATSADAAYQAIGDYVTSASILGYNITSFADVSVSAIADGQILSWNSVAGQFLNATQSGGISAITSATDVSVSSAVDGQVLSWNSAAGQWLNTTNTSGSLVLLATASAAGDAGIAFTSIIDTTYEMYQLHVIHAVPSVEGALVLHVSTDNGATYETSATHYTYAVNASRSDATTFDQGGTVADVPISFYGTHGNATNESASTIVDIINPATSTEETHFVGRFSSRDSANRVLGGIAGVHYNAATYINAIKVSYLSGDITSGQFKLYGVTKN